MPSSIESRLRDLREQRVILDQVSEMIKESFQPMNPPQLPQGAGPAPAPQGAPPPPGAPQGDPNAQAPPVDPATGQPMAPPPGAPPVDPATGQPMVDPAAAGAPPQGPPPELAQLMQGMDQLAQGMDQIAQAIEEISAKVNELAGTVKIQDKDVARLKDQVQNVEQEVWDMGKEFKSFLGAQEPQQPQR